MAAGRAVTAAAWAKAQTLYADRAVKVSEIAKLVGLSAIQLANEAKARGWPLRLAAPADVVEVVPGATKQRRAASSKTSSSSPSPKPMVLVQRVYKTIDSELSKLEQQKGVTSQDRERSSRALSQMVNSLEKAVEMQREMTKVTAKRSGVKDKEALAHAEDLRREIAERLERLHRPRAVGKRSGAAE